MIDQSWDNTSENTANEQHVIDKYEQMVRDIHQSGKEVPARPIYEDAVGSDFAKMQVENSQRLMKKSRSFSFSLPDYLGKNYERIFKHA